MLYKLFAIQTSAILLSALAPITGSRHKLRGVESSDMNLIPVGAELVSPIPNTENHFFMDLVSAHRGIVMLKNSRGKHIIFKKNLT